ncbi:MAG: hypothetical protein AAGE59_19285 [Cyanobacteria bacterium P01_F01_bin.86]
MKLDLSSQAPMVDIDQLMTRAVMSEVDSNCILARQIMDVLE